MPKKSVPVTLRKPQAPAEVEAFVEGPIVAVPVPAAPANPIQAAAELQHGTRNYREITLYLPTEVARDLSFYCMDKNRDINHVVAEAVSKHVATGAPESASAPRSSWGGTFEILIEQSRLKLSTLWALRRWTARAG
jgi:hypothetical protein